MRTRSGHTSFRPVRVRSRVESVRVGQGLTSVRRRDTDDLAGAFEPLDRLASEAYPRRGPRGLGSECDRLRPTGESCCPGGPVEREALEGRRLRLARIRSHRLWGRPEGWNPVAVRERTGAG